MSNILVAKNYTIKDHSKWWDDRTSEANLVDNYKQMEALCLQSAIDNLTDMDSLHVFTGEASDIREVFKKNFYEIYDLWKEGHNILYCDLDVVFPNKHDYFVKTDIFQMFNLTDPVSTTDEHYDMKFDHYFNCGIRYYPKNMSQEVWDLGFKMVENWNPDRWDSEQVIYNAMMFSQNITAQDVYQPQKAYQMLADPRTSRGRELNDTFNRINIQDAYAVHVHGSRGSSDRLSLMQAIIEGTLHQNDDEVLVL